MKKSSLWKIQKSVPSTPVELQYCRNSNKNANQKKIPWGRCRVFLTTGCLQITTAEFLQIKTQQKKCCRFEKFFLFLSEPTEKKNVWSLPEEHFWTQHVYGQWCSLKQQPYPYRRTNWCGGFVFWFLLRFSQTSCYTLECLSYDANSTCSEKS